MNIQGNSTQGIQGSIHDALTRHREAQNICDIYKPREAEQITKDEQEWSRLEPLALRYDPSLENEPDVKIAYYTIRERLMRFKIEQFAAKEKAVKNLHTANVSYEQNYQGEKRDQAEQNLLCAIREYSHIDSVIKVL